MAYAEDEKVSQLASTDGALFCTGEVHCGGRPGPV